MASHDEHHHLPATSNPLKWALVITGVIVAVELIGGIISNSLALIGDAGHMLVDVLSLALSLWAMTLAKRPATLKRTFGYHRAEVLAALANGATIGIVSIFIFYEAYQRFITPPEVKATIMLPVAIVGLLSNLAGILLLRRGSEGSLNIKSALWHIIGDTISSLGVIAAAIIIAITGKGIVDPIIAVFIGCIILWGAVRLVRESVDILSEAVPKSIQLDKVVEAIKNIGNGIEDVHDIHIWTLTSGIYALSAHLLITDQRVSKSAEIVSAVNQVLHQNFNITHATLQLECERCESCPDGLVCDLNELKKRA